MRDALGAVQSALLVGGTSDIGIATLRRMARERLRTAVLLARDTARAEEAARDLRAAGVATVDVVPFEATDTAAHERLVHEAFDRHGDLDCIIVALGVLGPGGDDQLQAAPELVRVNALGAVSAAVPAVRRLEAQGHGTLVVLSSVAAERPRRSNYAYGASKAGLDALAQGLHDAVRGRGLHVMTVRPGFVRTKMTRGRDEVPLAVDADQVAEAIVEGIRRGSATIWVPSAMRWVMLGVRMIPRPLFRRLPL